MHYSNQQYRLHPLTESSFCKFDSKQFSIIKKRIDTADAPRHQPPYTSELKVTLPEQLLIKDCIVKRVPNPDDKTKQSCFFIFAFDTVKSPDEKDSPTIDPATGKPSQKGVIKTKGVVKLLKYEDKKF